MARVACACCVMAPSACVLERRLPAVQHQDRIESRRIQRRRGAAPDGHFSDLGMPLHLDVGVQWYAHQEGGVFEHPGDVLSVAEPITIVIVAAVVDEERIIRVLAEAGPRICRRDRAGLAAVTGEAGPAVAAERLLVEEPRAFEKIDQRSGRCTLSWPPIAVRADSARARTRQTDRRPATSLCAAALPACRARSMWPAPSRQPTAAVPSVSSVRPVRSGLDPIAILLVAERGHYSQPRHRRVTTLRGRERAVG